LNFVSLKSTAASLLSSKSFRVHGVTMQKTLFGLTIDTACAEVASPSSLQSTKRKRSASSLGCVAIDNVFKRRHGLVPFAVSPANSEASCLSAAETIKGDDDDDDDDELIAAGHASGHDTEMAMLMENALAADSPLRTSARLVTQKVWPHGPQRTDVNRTKVTQGFSNFFFYFVMRTSAGGIVINGDVAKEFILGLSQLFAIPRHQHVMKKGRGRARNKKFHDEPDKNEWAKLSSTAPMAFDSRHPTGQCFCEDLVAVLAELRRLLAVEGIAPLENEPALVIGEGGSQIIVPFPDDACLALLSRQRVTFAVMSVNKPGGLEVRVQPSAIPYNAVPIFRCLLLEFMRLDALRFCAIGTRTPAFDFNLRDSSRVWVSRTSAVMLSPPRQRLQFLGHALLRVAGFNRLKGKPNDFGVGQVSMWFQRIVDSELQDGDSAESSRTFAQRAAKNEKRFIKASINNATGRTSWIAPNTRTVLLPGETPFPQLVIAKSLRLCMLANAMPKEAVTLALLFAEVAGIKPHIAGTLAMDV
jgi:hypothetical protein